MPTLTHKTAKPGHKGCATRLSILLLALSCTACGTSWPATGGGGMAEAHWPDQARVAIPDRLQERLTCTMGRLEALHEASVRAGINSGQVGLLDLTAARARREYAGRLYRDGAATLADLDSGIDQVRHDMLPPPSMAGDCA